MTLYDISHNTYMIYDITYITQYLTPWILPLESRGRETLSKYYT